MSSNPFNNPLWWVLVSHSAGKDTETAMEQSPGRYSNGAEPRKLNSRVPDHTAWWGLSSGLAEGP